MHIILSANHLMMTNCHSNNLPTRYHNLLPQVGRASWDENEHSKMGMLLFKGQSQTIPRILNRFTRCHAKTQFHQLRKAKALLHEDRQLFISFYPLPWSDHCCRSEKKRTKKQPCSRNAPTQNCIIPARPYKTNITSQKSTVLGW